MIWDKLHERKEQKKFYQKYFKSIVLETLTQILKYLNKVPKHNLSGPHHPQNHWAQTLDHLYELGEYCQGYP